MGDLSTTFCRAFSHAFHPRPQELTTYFKNLSKLGRWGRRGGGECLDLTDVNGLKFIVPFLRTKLTITMTITSFNMSAVSSNDHLFRHTAGKPG